MMHERVQSFIAQLPPINNDTSFEVRWSLSELEDIVFDFINAHDLPPEFKIPTPSLSASQNKAANGSSIVATATPTKKTVRISEDPEFGQRQRRDDDREALMNVKRGGKEENLP